MNPDKGAARTAKLAVALRDNLKRRKAQAQAKGVMMSTPEPALLDRPDGAAKTRPNPAQKR